jgi:hypothetical protein
MDNGPKRLYKTFKPGSKINLWCEKGKGSTAEDECLQPSHKRRKTLCEEDSEEQLDDIFDNLKEKNPKMEAPKPRLWAKLNKGGRYTNYEIPPNIPLIAGSTASKPRKENLTDAFAGAASAFAKVFSGRSETPSSCTVLTDNFSPMKKAALRRSCLEDLKKLNELLQEGVLTETEFANEKQRILHTLQRNE